MPFACSFTGHIDPIAVDLGTDVPGTLDFRSLVDLGGGFGPGRVNGEGVSVGLVGRASPVIMSRGVVLSHVIGSQARILVAYSPFVVVTDVS
jgi:hypothetical protein